VLEEAKFSIVKIFKEVTIAKSQRFDKKLEGILEIL